MKKYNELNISTFSELILGLPGETYTSFCEGVRDLIENGQHFAINIYPCELLPNSEMGQKEYQEKFGIKGTRVPFNLIHSNSDQDKNEITEYSEYITATDTMNSDEWARALLFSSYIQGLHNLGLLRAVAIYLRYEENIDYDKFYNMLIDYSEKHTGTLLNKVYTHIKDLCFGIISGTNGLVSTCDGLGEMWWGFDEVIFLDFYKELDVFYKEVQEFVNSQISADTAVSSLFDYQYSIIKKVGADTITINNDYDFYSYYNRIYLKKYEKLEKKEITLKVQDTSAVANLKDFAREVIWYGRNRRATDYTSTHYKINIL